MPSQTPKLALPYPLGTDLIADGDDSIKALAERLELIMSPAWTALPFGSGWSSLAGYQPCEYTKIFGWLYLRGHATTTSNGTTIATLPTGFRPAADLLASVNYWNGSGLSPGQLRLNATGVLLTSWTPVSGHNFGLVAPPIWVGP